MIYRRNENGESLSIMMYIRFSHPRFLATYCLLRLLSLKLKVDNNCIIT